MSSAASIFASTIIGVLKISQVSQNTALRCTNICDYVVWFYIFKLYEMWSICWIKLYIQEIRLLSYIHRVRFLQHNVRLSSIKFTTKIDQYHSCICIWHIKVMCIWYNSKVVGICYTSFCPVSKLHTIPKWNNIFTWMILENTFKAFRHN